MNTPIFCSKCGHNVPADANFCATCGTQVPAATFPEANPMWQVPLVRPRQQRMLAGVCLGVAQHYGWDPALVRLVCAVFTFFTSGLGFLIYAAAWVLIPEESFALSAGTPQQQGMPQGTV